METLPVPVFFDFACPWSYAARAREKRLADGLGVEFVYLPWDLDPTLPLAGQPNKFPTPSADLVSFAKEVGIDIPEREVRHNTRLALRGLPIARAHGRAHAFVDAALHAYWVERADLADDAVLARVAQRAGMDGEAFVARVRDPAWDAHLEAVDALGEKLDVQSTVTYVLPKGETYVGLDSLDALRARIEPHARS